MTFSLFPTCSSAILAGFLLALPDFLHRHGQGLNKSSTRNLALPFFLAMVPLMLVAGLLLDKGADGANNYDLLVLGGLLSAIGLATLGQGSAEKSFVVGMCLIGAGLAVLLPAVTFLMPATFQIPPAQAWNFGFAMVFLGFVLAPIFLQLMSRRIGFKKSVSLVAILAMVSPTLACLSPKEILPPATQSFDLGLLASDPRLGLALLSVFCYFPLEKSLGSWGKQYLADRGYNQQKLAWSLALMWLGFLAARLASPWFIIPGWEGLTLFVLTSIIVISFLNLVGGTPFRGSMLLLWICLGPIFPTLLGLVLPNVNGSATAFAALFCLGTLAHALLTPASGPSEGQALQVPLRFPSLLALALLVSIGLLILIR